MSSPTRVAPLLALLVAAGAVTLAAVPTQTKAERKAEGSSGVESAVEPASARPLSAEPGEASGEEPLQTQERKETPDETPIDSAAAERAGAAGTVQVKWPVSTATSVLAALPLLARGTAAAPTIDPWPEHLPHDAAGWTNHWSAFAADLAREAEWVAENVLPTAADGARLARLSLAAFHQGRDADGWNHLTALAARAPQTAAGLLAHVLVGGPLDATVAVRTEDPLLPGPWDGALAPGVVLRPALTPPAIDDPNGRSTRDPLEITGLTVGDSQVSMRLQVRGDGVDLRYRLDEGDPVEFAAVLPVPPGLSIAIEYFDWERAETSGQPLPVRLVEPGEWYRLWGRVRPDRAAWPTVAPDEVPRALELFGLELVIASDDPQAAYVAGFARACEDLFPFQVRRVEPDRPPFGSSAQRVDLTPSPGRSAKLRDLAGHLAHFVLSRSDAPTDR